MASNQTAADLTNLFGTVYSTISTPTAWRAARMHHEQCRICTLNTDIWGRSTNEGAAESTLGGEDGEGLLAAYHMHSAGRQLGEQGMPNWPAFHFPA